MEYDDAFGSAADAVRRGAGSDSDDSRYHELAVVLGGADPGESVGYMATDQSGVVRRSVCGAVNTAARGNSVARSRPLLERVAWPPQEAGRMRLWLPDDTTAHLEIVQARFHVSEALGASSGLGLPDPLRFWTVGSTLASAGPGTWARALSLDVFPCGTVARREAAVGNDAPAWASSPEVLGLLAEIDAAVRRAADARSQKKSSAGS